MHVLKVIFYWFSFIFFNVFLVLALIVPPITMHLTNRDSVRSWVTDEAVLDGAFEIVPEILSESIEESDVGVIQITENTVGIDHEALVDSIKEVLTNEYLVLKFDPLIDGVYDWLEGETESPEFNVVLTDKLTAVVNSVSKPLKSELAKLPECPPSIEYSEDFNPLNAFCVPPGTDVVKIVDDFSSQVTNGPDGLDISISSDDIDFDEDVIENAPRIYGAIDALPLAFATIALLFAVAVILLAKSVRRGLKTVAWILVVNGVVTALSFWIMTKIDFMKDIVVEGEDEIGTLVVEKIIKPLSQIVITDIAKTGITLSLIATAIGVIIWLSLYTHHKLHHEKKDNETSKKKPAKKIKDTTPTERQESTYINKISKK